MYTTMYWENDPSDLSICLSMLVICGNLRVGSMSTSSCIFNNFRQVFFANCQKHPWAYLTWPGSRDPDPGGAGELEKIILRFFWFWVYNINTYGCPGFFIEIQRGQHQEYTIPIHPDSLVRAVNPGSQEIVHPTLTQIRGFKGGG